MGPITQMAGLSNEAFVKADKHGGGTLKRGWEAEARYSYRSFKKKIIFYMKVKFAVSINGSGVVLHGPEKP